MNRSARRWLVLALVVLGAAAFGFATWVRWDEGADEQREAVPDDEPGPAEPTKGPDLSKDPKPVPSPTQVAPPAAAVSQAFVDRQRLFNEFRRLAQESASLDFETPHAPVFEQFRQERPQHHGMLGGILRDALAVPADDEHRLATIHLVISALEGVAPLGRSDGAALAVRLRAGDLGAPAFHRRGLLALAGSAPDAKRLTKFLLKLLRAPIPPDGGVVQALHTLAGQHEGMLETLRGSLSERTLNSERGLLLLLLTNDAALRELAAAKQGLSDLDDTVLRKVLVVGLADDDNFVRVRAASLLHERKLATVSDLWPALSAGLRDPREHVRAAALAIAVHGASKPREILDTVDAMFRRTGGVIKAGVRLSLLHRHRFESGALEERVRKLPENARANLAYYARHAELHATDPVPPGSSPAAAVEDGQRFYARILLRDPSSDVRARAVNAFGTLARLRDLIEPLVQDPDETVAQAAQRMLKRLDEADR